MTIKSLCSLLTVMTTIGLGSITTPIHAVAASNAAAAKDSPAKSILSNGDFETDADQDKHPDHWPSSNNIVWKSGEGGNHFLRLQADPGEMVTAYRLIPLKGNPEALELSYRARVNQLKRGKKNWHQGTIIMHFKDKDDQKVKPDPGHPNFHGSTEGWKKHSRKFLVPKGATKLEFMPAIFKGESGSFDLDDMTLKPTDPKPLRERAARKAKDRREEIAKNAAKVEAQVPQAKAEQLPPMLHVEANQIVDSNGKKVWLQGVAIPSLEWTAAGEHILESTRKAINDWNVNVIRLAVHDDYWRGEGKWQNDGGAGYRQLIDDVINLAGANGVYVAIDLHRFRAPKAVHAKFWSKVAKKYKNNPAVLFELFNEPHDVSWKVWRDGGFVSKKGKKDSDAIAENKKKLEGFDSVGMQGLVDAVRQTGAKNIVVAGGLDWAYDLSGVIDGYALDDEGGNGVVYAAHVYPWKSHWQSKFMDTAKQHPIFITECGAPQKRLSFIPKDQHEDPSTWVPDFLGLVQKYKYNWTGWSFHPSASPVLLKNWDYEPTSYWGAPAKAALHGKQFKLSKKR